MIAFTILLSVAAGQVGPGDGSGDADGGGSDGGNPSFELSPLNPPT